MLLMSEPFSDKKQTILDAAEKLFSKYGFDATSTREIAEEAGANVAMISYYFGSKENLLNAIVERYSNEIITKLTEVYNPDQKAHERLDRMIEAYLTCCYDHPDPVIIAHRELGVNLRPVLQDTIQCTFTKVRDIVSQIIQDGQKEGVFRDVDIQMMLHGIGSMVDSMLVEAYSLKRMGVDLKPFGIADTDDAESRAKVSKFLKELIHCYLKKE
jgi:AcrR family transcriptional regulator